MKRIVRVVLITAAIVMVLIQLFRPERTNPPTDPAMSIRATAVIPPQVLATLERSCFDCHSNETRWPWYSAITPMNFLVVDDVIKARKRVNFSEWGKQKPMKRQGLLQMIDDQVALREMPLRNYLILHPQASLADSDIAAISRWVVAEQDRLSKIDANEER
ncbi:MAG: heme-binding domain-containing protein [Bacteroidota bacterium]